MAKLSSLTKSKSRGRPVTVVAGLLVALLSLSVLGTLLFLIPGLAQAQTAPGAGAGSILTVIVRDSYGKPLSGAKCEVLSYDWGRAYGKAYAVIAAGETNGDGAVAFEESSWPHSGYWFRFTPTDHTRPANTYFLPEEQNQYRGYPAAVVGAWGLPQIQSGPIQETEYFVIAADGLAYTDLARGKGSPAFERDPVGGMTLSRVSPQAMSSQNYLATARAATATAFANGVPTQTLPPPPVTFSGMAAGPLPITPNPGSGSGPAGGGGGGTTTTPSVASAQALVTTTQTSLLLPTPLYTAQNTSQQQPQKDGQNQPAQSQGHKSDGFSSVLLALFGITCLFFFFVYRRRIYSWLGVDLALVELPNRSKPTTKAKATNKNKNKLSWQPGRSNSAEAGSVQEVKSSSSSSTSQTNPSPTQLTFNFKLAKGKGATPRPRPRPDSNPNPNPNPTAPKTIEEE